MEQEVEPAVGQLTDLSQLRGAAHLVQLRHVVGAEGRLRVVGAGDLDWVVHHFSPWLGKAVRHVPHGLGVTAKRPEPTVVPRSAVLVDGGTSTATGTGERDR